MEAIFIHRKADQPKRNLAWVANLREAAEMAVKSVSTLSETPKGTLPKRRYALEVIIPALFDIALSYENHILQYGLHEESTNIDPQKGRYHTWVAAAPTRKGQNGTFDSQNSGFLRPSRRNGASRIRRRRRRCP